MIMIEIRNNDHDIVSTQKLYYTRRKGDIKLKGLDKIDDANWNCFQAHYNA